MNPPSPPPAQLLVELGFGYILSGALAAATELGVADQLAHGPLTPSQLAQALGAEASALFRILRLLASAGVFLEDSEGRFGLTPAAELLRSGVPGSLREAVLMLTQQVFWTPAGELAETVRTGKTPFDRIFGSPFFDYLTSHPAAGATFHRGMSSLSDLENGPIARSYDFSPFRRVVDVGGGHGGLLIEILHSTPGLRGVLLDQAPVLADSRIASAGLSERCEHVVGDFFQSVPAGADVYVLKRILHDWNDEVCVNLLRHCREAMPETGRVLVIDTVIPPGNAPHGGKVLDVMMLASLPGRERSEAEFSALFTRAGLRLSRVLSTPTALSITEALAA